jgi:SPP1 gp7 family putative phage head morphogenesis protein
MIRRAFEAEFNRRFALLSKAIYDLIVKQDALGLKAPANPLTTMAWTDEARAAALEARRQHIHTAMEREASIAAKMRQKPRPAIYQSTQSVGGGKHTQSAVHLPAVKAQDHPEHSESILTAYHKLKDTGTGFVSWDRMARETGLSVQVIAEQIKAAHLTKPGSIGFTVDRSGAGTYFKIKDSSAFPPPKEEKGITTNAPSFKFLTVDRKLAAFNRWLSHQVNQGILVPSPTSVEPRGLKPWLYTYVDSAYKKGAIRAYLDTWKKDLAKPEPFYEGSQRAFLESAFSRPERVGKLRLLYTRSYESLKNITSQMASEMSRQLADGLAHGKGPMEIARGMAKAVGMARVRAKVIARTETIHAHAEGQLDGMEDLGVEQVGAEVEWSTAGDDGVCPKCEEMEGQVFDIDDARGMIPLHPNCRCAWVPVLPKSMKVRKER